jgi:hypothetical protein
MKQLLLIGFATCSFKGWRRPRLRRSRWPRSSLWMGPRQGPPLWMGREHPYGWRHHHHWCGLSFAQFWKRCLMLAAFFI